MPINCKGINASRINIPKSGIKYNQLIIVIRGEPINLVWPPKGFNKFNYNIRYTTVVVITNSTKIISSIVPSPRYPDHINVDVKFQTCTENVQS